MPTVQSQPTTSSPATSVKFIPGEVPDPGEIYSRYQALSLYYGSRNDCLDSLQTFFSGTQWSDTKDTKAIEEELLLTLNYARRAVLWHTALFHKAPFRVDIPGSADKEDPASARREKYLRSIASSPTFRRMQRRAELGTSKYGYSIVQVIWKPEVARKISHEVGGAEGVETKTQTIYDRAPIVFRTVNPRRFYPRYRTYDDPDDFLYVIKYDPKRLVEDLAQEYKQKLQATAEEGGSIGTCDLVEYWDDTHYILLALTRLMVEGDKPDSTVELVTPHLLVKKEHGYGRPPFFVLVNVNADNDEDPTYGGCISEVELIQESNKHLNLIFSLSATEIARRIHPPVVYKSDNPQQDPTNIKVGAGEVITIGEDEDLDVLEWKGIPAAVQNHMLHTMRALQDLSGLPKTSLAEQEAPSGIGLRLAFAAVEMTLPLKVPEREDWLRGIFEFVLYITDKKLAANTAIKAVAPQGKSVILRKSDVKDEHNCTVKFGNIMPRDKIQYEQHIIYLLKTDTISLRDALEMLEDIEDPDETIERIRKEHQDPLLHPELAATLKALQEPTQPTGRQPGQAAAGPPGPPGMGMPGGAPGALRGGGAGAVPQGARRRPPPGGGLKFNAAPPVPQLPSMPTQRNAPFLQRGVPPNLGQVFPGGPGVNVGPPIEEQY